MKRKKWQIWLIANFCRLLLSATFLFSGIVKLIDPRGTQYKLEDYAVAFDLYGIIPQDLFLVVAVMLALLETYIGFNLFWGIRRRTTTRLALIVMLVFTPVTLWLAMTGTMHDCGCFGDVIHLTPWQTVGKNVVLLAAAVVTVLNSRRLMRLITERNQWLLSIYAIIFSLLLVIYDIRYLPVIDFRPYHVGVDLPKAITEELSNNTLSYQYLDFSMQTQEGEDITFEWLEQPGYKFLLVSPDLEKADDSMMDRINAIYDYAQAQGYPFLALTSSLKMTIDRWKDMTGAEYDFAIADGTMLKTMIRSNPGLFLFCDGVIYQKWSCYDLPVLEEEQLPLTDLKIGKMRQGGYMVAIYRLLIWFVLPLFLWAVIDRIWVGSKFYRRHKLHKDIESSQ